MESEFDDYSIVPSVYSGFKDLLVNDNLGCENAADATLVRGNATRQVPHIAVGPKQTLENINVADEKIINQRECGSSFGGSPESGEASAVKHPPKRKSHYRQNCKLSVDPQSVAARHRRHRISKRFKILQTLVPGGTKMDTASMLDEAIQYVKFLKTQIWIHEMIGYGCIPTSSAPGLLTARIPATGILPFVPNSNASCYSEGVQSNVTNSTRIYGRM